MNPQGVLCVCQIENLYGSTGADDLCMGHTGLDESKHAFRPSSMVGISFFKVGGTSVLSATVNSPFDRILRHAQSVASKGRATDAIWRSIFAAFACGKTTPRQVSNVCRSTPMMARTPKTFGNLAGAGAQREKLVALVRR